MKGSGKAVGIEDVARAASVSITTVSHALSGRGHVAPATRERVRAIAAELGYTPDRLASALRGRRSNILGFVSDNIATTPYATRLVLGAQDAAAASGQLLVVVNSNSDSAVESAQIAALRTAHVDAIVFARMFHQAGLALPVELGGIPTALVDTTDARGLIPSVVPDEEQIGRIATELLIEHGHTQIAHLTIDVEGRASTGRLAGYRAAMEAAGLRPASFSGEDPPNAAAGRSAFRRLLAAGDASTTAVVVFNDAMAMGVYQQATLAGLSVPDDLSVVGVDDFEPVAAAIMPGLTTVALPHYEMGRWGVETALVLLEGPLAPGQPVNTLLPGTMVVRDSVAPPRSEAVAV